MPFRQTVVVLLGACVAACTAEPSDSDADECTDLDGDGWSTDPFCGPLDCDDTDSGLNPESVEIAGNDVDEDCDAGPLPFIIYVSETTGSVEGPGTPEAPFRAIGEAIFRGVQAGSTLVRVAGGTYNERLQPLLDVEGGYDPATWARDPEVWTTTVRSEIWGEPPLFTKPGDPAVTVSGFALEWVLLGSEKVTLSDVRIEYSVEIVGPGAVALDRVVLGRTQHSRVYAENADVAITSTHIDGSLQVDRGTLSITDSTVTGGVDVWDYGEASRTCALAANGLVAPAIRIVGASCAFEIVDSDLTSGGSVLRVDDAVGRVERSRLAGFSNYATTEGVIGAEDAAIELVDTVVVAGGGDNRVAVRAFRTDLSVANSVLVATNTIGYTPAVTLGSGGEARFVNTVLKGQGLAPTLETSNQGAVSLSHVAWIESTCATRDGSECFAVEDVDGCAWDGCESSVGSVAADAGAFVGDGDYHLAPNSPLVDAGADPAPQGITVGAADADGDARPQGLGWDIGVDEVPD